MERAVDNDNSSRARRDASKHGAARSGREISEGTSHQQGRRQATQPGIGLGGVLAQAKLAVGPVDDRFEREADLTASRVVRALQLGTPVPDEDQTDTGPRVQRSAHRAPEAVDDRLGEADRISRIQRSTVVGAQGGDLDEDTARLLNSSRSGGAPLPEPARSKMEGAFGADFSGIRVHAGPRSTELNNRIQAKAFTTGNDIFFRDGVPDATTGNGQELLAHELTHTIQQGAADPINRSTEAIQRDGVLHMDENGVGHEAPGSGVIHMDGSGVGHDAPGSGVIHMDSGGVGHDSPFLDGQTGVGEYIASPTSLSELANSAEVSHGFWAKDDKVLLDILRGPFEANWFKAKACLAMDQWPLASEHPKPSHEVGIQLMQALVDMRGRVWDAFVQEVQPQIMGEVMRVQLLNREKFANLQNPKNNAKGDGLSANFGLKESVGSESVTSDIDLSARGENTEIGLAMINREFPKHFGVTVEPGALLDINVYSSDWMFGGTQVKGTKEGEYRIKPTEEGVEEGGQLSDEGQKKKDDQNEIWSMVKIRRNMNSLDWEDYKQILLNGLDSASQDKEMRKKFAVADSEYKAFRNDVAVNVAAMEKALDHEASQQQSVFAEKGKDHFAHDANEMKVSNRRYEQIVLNVKEMRLRIKMLQAVDDLPAVEIEPLLLKMHNEIARGLTYANEVYATQGAVLHTVYGNQGKVKKLSELQNEQDGVKKASAEALAGGAIMSVEYDLTKEMYLQSLNENVGDTLHSLKHNAGDPQYAVYRAGKYISRLCDAAKELIGTDAAESISGYGDLDKIGKDSVIEKKGAAGKDPKAVQKDESEFSSFTANDLPIVKNKAIVLGARAAAIYKKSKA
ncbi:DUF4157 domain-containing protein [Ilumatobacter sp.]|uniref:eCIS core domain-containing protein n=4 Tax=Ilumatobacter sp. TaxID=1967498 RepID=UPI002A2AD596|nr:DUF4157 domain-containing protein [Ilumatobacter sp.]